ncbi:MAG: NAD-dependent epimerase/dehydratase family protein [Candidatus Hydrogenedens sp.]|nr:NAD-dependent epimerase/dehydratase family protein [Candidatus Hydrogenedens sp.]
MFTLVTGAAGFIGYHVATALLQRGNRVIGIDNLCDYYDVGLKRARLAQLSRFTGFDFAEIDIADREAVEALIDRYPDFDTIVHFAAQAGVRYSLTNPYTYVKSNVMGQVVILEAARRLPRLRHLVYASSSSVYGANATLPFAVTDRVDHPISLYASTKRAGELIVHTYSHLWGLPATGLRFFTVYGPWGRPDMAAYLFADAIVAGRPIRVFNQGQMQRDFTYIDDIVAGVLVAADRPPAPDATGVRHALYNLGNHRAENLMDFVSALETAFGRKVLLAFEPMQPGDVPATFADIEPARRDLGFEPKTSIAAGIPKFVAWYKDYHGVT